MCQLLRIAPTCACDLSHSSRGMSFQVFRFCFNFQTAAPWAAYEIQALQTISAVSAQTLCIRNISPDHLAPYFFDFLAQSLPTLPFIPAFVAS